MKTFAELNFPGRLIRRRRSRMAPGNPPIGSHIKTLAVAEGARVYFNRMELLGIVQSGPAKGKSAELITHDVQQPVHGDGLCGSFTRLSSAPLLRVGLYRAVRPRYFHRVTRRLSCAAARRRGAGLYNFPRRRDPRPHVFFSS